MTDAEIIKALGSFPYQRDCVSCDIDSCNNSPNYIMKCARDLINRQKAELDDLKRDDLPRCKDALRRANEIGMALEKENQKLKEENDRWKSVMETVAKCASEARQIAAKHARAEAVREFAERLIARCGAPHWCVWMGEISEEMEEMVGDGNENL